MIEPYVSIALIALVVKVGVAIYVLTPSSGLDQRLRPTLWIASILFISYSLPQILLLAPDTWAEQFGMARFQVLRLYYYHGTLCLICGIYACLELLKLNFHRSSWMLILIACYALIAFFAIVFTDWLVPADYQRIPFRSELSSKNVSPAVFLTRLSVVIILTGILFGFLRAYRTARSNQAQIASYYAIVAGLIFYANCIAGLFISHPFIFSIRGLFFYLAIMLVAIDRRKFDARTLTPATLEHKVSTELQGVFGRFANEDITYRDAVREIEQQLVQYKLQKVSGFKQSPGSTLPDVASNMRISLSSLYDLIKRLELRRPDR